MARQTLYGFLSLATSDPRSRRWIKISDRTFQDRVIAAAEFLRSEISNLKSQISDLKSEISDCRLAPGELPIQHLDPQRVIDLIPSREQLIDEHQRIFGLMVPRNCPPYETEYCPKNLAWYRAQQMADIAGFYRAFGLVPSRDLPERADHIALELEFMAWLITKEQHAIASSAQEHAQTCCNAQATFLRDHLAWWTPAFAYVLRHQAEGIAGLDELSRTPTTFHGAVAILLAAMISAERLILDVAPPRELAAPSETQDEAASCAGCAQAGEC